MMSIIVNERGLVVSLVVLLNSPSAHGMQSKQQMGFPLTKALLVPGGQDSLHTDLGA